MRRRGGTRVWGAILFSIGVGIAFVNLHLLLFTAGWSSLYAYIFFVAGFILVCLGNYLIDHNWQVSVSIMLIMVLPFCIGYWVYWLLPSVDPSFIQVGVIGVLSLLLYIIFSAVPTALRNLTKVFLFKGVKDVIVTFCVFYLSMTFLFGFLYATVCKVDPSSFKSSQSLSLFDFIS